MKFLDRNARDSALYLITAALCTFFLLTFQSRGGESGPQWSGLIVFWLITCAGPLLFIFAYSRFLFSKSDVNRSRKWFAVRHIVLAISAAGLFIFLSPFRQNPVRNFDFSVPGFLAVLAVLITFSVSAFFLLFKNKSTLATVASVLFWPYWLFLALLCEERWFEGIPIQAGSYWFFFMVPVFCAFAAGTLAHRPVLAHSAVLATILSVPWIYRELTSGNGFYNLWLMFNLPGVDRPIWIFPAIFFAGLITLTVISAAIRLLPSRWQVRKHPLRDRTWPAFVMTVLFLSIWFRQSVMPYRIPGAVDYSRFPILQILHIEKRGLQFHEVCANVWGYREEVRGAYFFEDNRRLFQYGFELKNSSADPPQALVERIRNFLKSSHSGE